MEGPKSPSDRPLPNRLAECANSQSLQQLRVESLFSPAVLRRSSCCRFRLLSPPTAAAVPAVAPLLDCARVVANPPTCPLYCQRRSRRFDNYFRWTILLLLLHFYNSHSHYYYYYYYYSRDDGSNCSRVLLRRRFPNSCPNSLALASCAAALYSPWYYYYYSMMLMILRFDYYYYYYYPTKNRSFLLLFLLLLLD